MISQQALRKRVPGTPEIDPCRPDTRRILCVSVERPAPKTTSMRKKILLICGSLNQTTQMHQIAEELSDCDLFFTPFYGDLLLSLARRFNLAEFTVMGTKFSSRCL